MPHPDEPGPGAVSALRSGEAPAQLPRQRAPRFRPRSSLDYLLRTVQQVQLQYSAMADAKANMMITVSSVVFSITLSRLNSGELRWPLLTLGGFSLCSLIAAVLAATPVDTRPGSAPAPGKPGFNLMFFGHFHQMPFAAFEAEFERVAAEDDRLYQAVLQDIYGAGMVLAKRKFRRLRVSYGFFIAGIVVAAIELAYVVAAGNV